MFNIVGNLKKKCGHHEKSCELKQLLFLRVYLLDGCERRYAARADVDGADGPPPLHRTLPHPRHQGPGNIQLYIIFYFTVFLTKIMDL